jgi:hypothetical protein
MCINENDTSKNNKDDISEINGEDEEDEIKEKSEEEDSQIEENPDKDYIENDIIKNIQTKYLDYLNNLNDFPKNKYINNKLYLLFKIPGLYNLY